MADKRLRIWACGKYAGRGRRAKPNPQTRRLLASKYHANAQARAEMVAEMAQAARAARCDFITYALAHDSGTQHARHLAQGIARALRLPLVPPSKAKQFAGRGLPVDDVYTTGRTLRNLAARLAPASLRALVYLAAPRRPGLNVVRRGA